MNQFEIPSTTHLVLIPSYNSGAKLLETVEAALRYWRPVWVVIDGSDDKSQHLLLPVQNRESRLSVFFHERNLGKGAAVLTGMRAAFQTGFRFVLVMDADGQHPADQIPVFMRLSQENDRSMILGEPNFGHDAPLSRKYGRRVGNWWANLETFWGGINDSLFGFRVYPVKESIGVLDHIRGGRRYDFDTELSVRLYWLGVRPINVKVPVQYPSAKEGGTSHFHYLRDNLLLFKAHFILFFGMLVRAPRIWRLRRRA